MPPNGSQLAISPPAGRPEQVRGAQRLDACGARKEGLDHGGLRGPRRREGRRSEEIAVAVANLYRDGSFHAPSILGNRERENDPTPIISR